MKHHLEMYPYHCLTCGCEHCIIDRISGLVICPRCKKASHIDLTQKLEEGNDEI